MHPAIFYALYDSQSTSQGELFMRLAMCGTSNSHWGPMASLFERATPLMHNCIWPYWFVVAHLSNVISAFVASQQVAKCHPLSFLLSTYFFNARCLVIWLSEHRIFTYRLVLNDHSSATDEHWHLIISQFAENLQYYNMPAFYSDPYILFEDLTCAKIKSDNFCPRVYLT